MGSNSNHHDDPCIQLLGPDGIQENWDSKGDGSNATLLPEKKKKSSKSKGGKASNKSKSKQQPPMSKSKQRKLKQLQEEEEKKLLHSKSIRLLEKYKIWDGAYSLLHPSGTIGKVETLREKRRRAVQFSKAGLEVMEDVMPFKKKASIMMLVKMR